MDVAFYESINAQISHHLENIEAQQVSVEMSDDMLAFKAAHEGLKGPVHPTLDVDASTITPGTARWLCLKARRHAGSNSIGIIACRIFDNTDLAHLFHSRVIWGDRRHAEQLSVVEPIRHDWNADLSAVRGRLVYGGGAFLDRGFKGNELGRSMAALMHAVCMRVWNPDFLFNMMKADKLGTKVPPERFGYRHSAIIFDPQTQPDWGPMNAHKLVNWKSRAEEMQNYPGVQTAA